MRIETTAHRIVVRATGAAGVLTSLINRMKIAGKDYADARERAIAADASPTIESRQADLVRLYEHYEDLVETLCDAAQFGPTPKLERVYAEQKVWMAENYPSIRRFVGAYLRTEVDERDPFDELVVAENLSEFLANDDGGMIGRITQTREALNLYGEHLRQLAARPA